MRLPVAALPLALALACGSDAQFVAGPEDLPADDGGSSGAGLAGPGPAVGDNPSIGPGPGPGEPDSDGECLKGGNCEFDAECCESFYCLAAACLPRPGQCQHNIDCPGALVCIEGECGNPGGCVLDADCPPDMACAGGRCVPGAECGRAGPDPAGAWVLESELRLGEGVDPFLGAVLEVIDEIEDFVCPALGIVNGDAICAILGVLSDLNDMLDVMHVRQRIVLTADGAGGYTGTEEWLWVAFELDGELVAGDPDDVYDWEIDVEDFTAAESCGTLAIGPHDVQMNFCNIILWAIDTAVWVSSESRYRSLEDMLADVCGPLNFVCRNFIEDALDDLLGCGGLELMRWTYQGEARIAGGGNQLLDGVWSGTLELGDDFSGDFTGLRE